MFEVYVSGVLNTITDPLTMVMVFVGTFMGLVFGCLPGLTASMGIALLIPLTFTLDPVTAIGMMLGCYVGGMAGGAISAILLNIPGTPSAVVTTIDGHPMAQNGQANKALGWAVFASGAGSLVSWLILVTLAPALASLCTSFSAPEYASLALFGLTIIAAVSGKNLAKGLVAGCIGLVMSFVGVDPIWGELRFTFHNVNLMSGINLLPAMIGLYSIPQILASVCEESSNVKARKISDYSLRSFIPPWSEWKEAKWNIMRSSLIGTAIGIVPAAGANIATFLAYDQAKRFSKDPDSFGKGNYNGVIASEASNNGVCGGALVPMMTLGIPGDAVTSVLLGGLMIQGLTPGSLLFTEHMDVVIGMFTTLLVGTIFMVLIQLVAMRLFVRVLDVPTNYLNACLVVLSLVGSFALRNNLFDVAITIFLGLVGYVMARSGFPTAPTVLGLVLGTMFEREVRMALRSSHNDWSIFITRPVTCVFVVLSFIFVANSLLSAWKEKKAAKQTVAN
ncbi:MAG: tripartite tricarboxylate transporter permease [Candidatus Heteroscillospira sp.]|jgi:putative tricarboxylic transport membrane protein